MDESEQKTDRYDYGPLQTYEVIWESGHVERIQAHQVTHPNNAAALFGGRPDVKQVIEFHGEIEGRWRLQLRAPLDDILVIRNLTTTEVELS